MENVQQNKFVCIIILMNSSLSMNPSPLISASTIMSSNSCFVNLTLTSWQASFRLSMDNFPALSENVFHIKQT